MDQQLREKIEKVKRLIKQGSTQGERDAAKSALERIMKANNLTEKDLTPKQNPLEITITGGKVKASNGEFSFEVSFMDMTDFLRAMSSKKTKRKK